MWAALLTAAAAAVCRSSSGPKAATEDGVAWRVEEMAAAAEWAQVSRIVLDGEPGDLNEKQRQQQQPRFITGSTARMKCATTDDTVEDDARGVVGTDTHDGLIVR